MSVRILVTIGVFVILCRYVCQTTAMLFAKTDRELLIIGSLPMVYYIFDYATTKFSSLLYTGNKAVPEFLGLCHVSDVSALFTGIFPGVRDEEQGRAVQ